MAVEILFIQGRIQAADINPLWHSPVVARNNLVYTGCVGRVGRLALEILVQFLGTEKDPMILVAAIELVFELADGEKNVREIAVIGQCDQGCAWLISSKRSRLKTVDER